MLRKNDNFSDTTRLLWEATKKALCDRQTWRLTIIGAIIGAFIGGWKSCHGDTTVKLWGKTPYQDVFGAWRDQYHNPSVPGTDTDGQPNNHHHWFFPGGVRKLEPVPYRASPQQRLIHGFESIKEYTFPKDTQVLVWRGYGKHNLMNSKKLLRWTFPKGTKARVKLIYQGEVFAIHTSTKLTTGYGIQEWEGEEDIVGDPPPFYSSPDNCMSCHEDTAKHVSELEPGRSDYYGYLRGSDGRFSWYPRRGHDDWRWATP